jgi:hypothetical protein
MQGFVNNYFKKLIHSLSTDLSTGWLADLASIKAKYKS